MGGGSGMVVMGGGGGGGGERWFWNGRGDTAWRTIYGARVLKVLKVKIVKVL